MNLKQPLDQLFHLDADSFIICTGLNYKSVLKRGAKSSQTHSLQIFSKIINTLGQLSAKSQNLKQIITNMTKFSGTTQRIYIKIKGNQAVGFVKVGQKNLFYRDYNGAVKELQPKCVLDIYVHQSCQRAGYGKEIFQKFLQCENVLPQKLAYDRPSSKLISFLKKYYNLTEFVPQNNNYVIFNKFFISESNGKTVVNQYFFPNKQRVTQNTREKQNNRSFQVVNQKSFKGQDTNAKLQRQPKAQIIDSLQTLKMQVQRSKQRTPTLPPPVNSQISMQQNQSTSTSYKNIQNYHDIRRSSASKATNIYNNNNVLNGNQLSSFDKKLRDLSYRVPWATQNNDNSKKITSNLGTGLAFRTTSNAYGNYYNRP